MQPIQPNNNVLYDLARSMCAEGHQNEAIALRILAQAGFTNLAEVDATPDWELLTIRNIGPGRLGAVRRLTRADWLPPSRAAVAAATRFQAAGQLAARFWSVEELAPVVEGELPDLVGEVSIEGRLALQLLGQAAERARQHCRAGDLLQLLERVQSAVGGTGSRFLGTDGEDA